MFFFKALRYANSWSLITTSFSTLMPVILCVSLAKEAIMSSTCSASMVLVKPIPQQANSAASLETPMVCVGQPNKFCPKPPSAEAWPRFAPANRRINVSVVATTVSLGGCPTLLTFRTAKNPFVLSRGALAKLANPVRSSPIRRLEKRCNARDLRSV